MPPTVDPLGDPQPPVSRSLTRALLTAGQAWLEASQRRQLRRVRLWEAGLPSEPRSQSSQNRN